MDVMVLNSNGSDLKQALEVQHIFDRRNKIILHNNYCILETVSFYEHVLLNNVIKPFFFNDNYTKYCEISEVIDERLSFMDRFKIVKKIAKIFSVSDFKKIDNFIKLRNRIAHNLSSVSALNIETKENEIVLGGEKTTWDNYLEDLNEWANLSHDIARFVMNVFCQVNPVEKFAAFMYCKIEGNCVLVQHNLIYPEPEGEYTSFFKTGFNMDLLEYVNEELQYNKEGENNE